MQSKIRNITSNCIECAKINAGRLQYAPQQFNNTIDEAMKNVYVDFLQMIESKSAMNYIIVAIDYFTKFVWLKLWNQRIPANRPTFLSQSCFNLAEFHSCHVMMNSTMLESMLFVKTGTQQ